MNYSQLKYDLDRGIPQDGDVTDSEEILWAAEIDTRMPASNVWRNNDTGKIITESEAKALMGVGFNRHAQKCHCWECK